MSLKEIAQIIASAKHILITAHTNPDGDAIGAMVAMGHFCKQQDIPYTILLEKPLEKFKYLTDQVVTANKIDSPIDTIVALDCGNPERLIGYEMYFHKANTTIVIDHHITNDHYAMYNYVIPEASSTSELVFNLIETSKIDMDQELAKALYTGMVTDTGGFMHSCTSPDTMRACAKLMEVGFDFSTLYHKLMHEKSLVTIKLQSVAVSHLKKVKEGIYLAFITEEEMEQLKATKEDVDSIVSFLKAISGVKVIAFLYPLDKGSGYKLSTRSTEPYDVAAFCQQFKGGGHIRAAGATLSEDLKAAISKIEAALRQL